MLWSAWYDHTMPELNGVELPLLDMQLRNACIEFCNETAAYVLPLALVDVLATVSEYSLASPDDQAEVFMVRAAWLNDHQLDYAPVRVLETGYVAWETMTGDPPTAYTQTQYNQVRLFPIPTAEYAAALRMTGVLRPTLAATGLADRIAVQYFRAIAAGAKTLLMSMGGKPWTNPEGAVRYRAEFEAAKTKATIDANRSYLPSALQVQLRAVR